MTGMAMAPATARKTMSTETEDPEPVAAETTTRLAGLCRPVVMVAKRARARNGIRTRTGSGKRGEAIGRSGETSPSSGQASNAVSSSSSVLLAS